MLASEVIYELVGKWKGRYGQTDMDADTDNFKIYFYHLIFISNVVVTAVFASKPVVNPFIAFIHL